MNMKYEKNSLFENIKDTLMGKALVELNAEMERMNIKHISLDIVGGFALMARGIRKDMAAITDIDYVGASFPKELTPVIEKIGDKYGLGHDWVNNDLVMDGLSVDEFSYSTGDLHFDNAVNMSSLSINFLREEDLLRLKILSLDTAMCAQELGGDFTRMKDFADVVALKEKLNLPWEIIEDMCEPYLLSMDVFDMIEAYEIGGEEAVCDYLSNRQVDLDLDESIDDLLSEVYALERGMEYDL